MDELDPHCYMWMGGQYQVPQLLKNSNTLKYNFLINLMQITEELVFINCFWSMPKEQMILFTDANLLYILDVLNS